MAKLTPDATRTEHGLVINEKIIPWGAVWPKDSGAYKKGAQYKADRLLSGGTGKVKGVTIHNTADLKNVEEDAEQYTRATWPNGNMNDARVHYYVDDINAWQNLREDEVGWHAGDGRKATGGNETTLSIEIIMDGTGSKEDRKAEENGVLLAALLLKKHGLSENQLIVDDETLDAIISGYTREAGVRRLEQVLAKLCRKAARHIADGGRRLTVSNRNIEELLGVAPFKKDVVSAKDEVGIVNGLAWTSVGGEVLDVECSVVPGSGKLELTGNLGDVMKESCQAAVTYIRSRTSELGIDPAFHKNTDIHLHFPEGAVPKDGPSAGAAICLCVVSALTNRPVRADIAMTGEITLRGRVLPIGGIQEKTMAALRAGIHEVLLPEDNVSDLAEMDPNVRNAVNFTAVSHMDQVLKKALRPAGEKVAE